MASEIGFIIKNKTWELVDKPNNRKMVSNRFILIVKRGKDGTIERKKARIVARGFSQQPGIDFLETYSPVVKMKSIRLLVSLATIHNMEIHQIDVTTAYLNGTLDEEIFMSLSDYFEKGLNYLCENSSDTKIKQEAIKMKRK